MYATTSHGNIRKGEAEWIWYRRCSSCEGISRLTQAWGPLVIAGSLITCRTHLNSNATRKGDYEAFVTCSMSDIADFDMLHVVPRMA